MATEGRRKKFSGSTQLFSFISDMYTLRATPAPATTSEWPRPETLRNPIPSNGAPRPKVAIKKKRGLEMMDDGWLLALAANTFRKLVISGRVATYFRQFFPLADLLPAFGQFV